MKPDTKGLAGGEIVTIVFDRPFTLRQPSFWYKAVRVVEVFGRAINRESANANASLLMDKYLALYTMRFMDSGMTYTPW